MFENDVIVTRGHRQGLISDGGVFPDDSVIDCNNLDFFESEDRRRLPYSMLVEGQAEFLPAGYAIIGFYEKQYVDADSNVVNVLVVVAKHSVNKDIKIYTNKYYNPSVEFGNNYQFGFQNTWIDGWTELTELYFHSDTSDVFAYVSTVSTDPLIYKFRTTLSDYDKPDDYFNGFWLYQLTTGLCIGQVVNFGTVAGYFEFDVAINSCESYLNLAKVRVSTSGTLPTGLFAGVDYYVIKVTDTTIKLADSLANASLGVAIDFTSAGGFGALNITGNNSSSNTTFTANPATDILTLAAPFTLDTVISAVNQNRFYLTRFPLNVFANRLLRNRIDIVTITQTNPAVITVATDHGIKVGDTVGIDEVQGMTEINGLYLTVTAVTGSTVTVSVDAAGFSAYTNKGRVEGKFDFQDINTAHFEESFNAVKICIGNVMRPIEVSFLQRKKYWSDAITTAAGYTYKSGWDGFYFAYDLPKVENIGTVLSFTNGSALGVFYYGNSVIGRELGIRLKFDNEVNSGSSPVTVDTVQAVMITLDGYQYVFLKYATGRAYTSSGSVKTYRLLFYTQYLVDFDRRITASNYFGDAPANIPEELIGEAQAFKELLSFQFNIGNGGIEKTDICAKTGILNYYQDTNANRSNILNYNPEEWIKQYATGITLNSALNEKYYHTPVSAFRFQFRLNQNLIGVDLNKDYLATDSLQRDNYGLSKIVISNIQFGADGETPINAEGSFGEERIRHLIQGQKITAGSSTIGNQFVLFTELQMYHFELVDDVAGKINEFRRYNFAGTYSTQTMVKAKILDNFAGLYYINNSTIYRFLDNAPEDLLVNRWKDEFQAIPEADKRNAIVGYMPYNKEVFFSIGDTIYIWNIIYENWKKYTFRDVPTYISSAISGQLYFTDGTNIYAQEIIGTTLINDETSDQVNAGIGFKLKKRLTHGSTIANKIPDRVDFTFEMDSESNDIADLEIKIGKNGSNNNILDSLVINMTDEINTELEGKKSVVLGAANNSVRARANYYDVTMEYVPPGDASPLKFFKLKELLINAKKGLRLLTKI